MNLLKIPFILLVFILFLLSFFSAVQMPLTFRLATLLLIGILGFSGKSVFKYYIILFIIALLPSIISCKIYHNQDYLSTFKAIGGFFFIIIYFGLKSIRPSIAQIEKMLLYLILLFCCCYLMQFILYPNVIFDVVIKEKEGNRITFIAQGLASLGLFYGINKFLIERKYIYVCLSLVCYIIIFLHGYRTIVITSAIFSIILYFRINKFHFRYLFRLIPAFLLLIFIYQIPVINEKVEFMLNRTNSTMLSEDDYRMINLYYHYNSHFSDIFEYIFGSGLPYQDTIYAADISGLEKIGIWYTDLGLLGLSWYIGVIPVILIIIMNIKAFNMPVDKKYMYLGTWLLYLLFSTTTTHELYINGNIVIIGIALYMIETLNNKYDNSHMRG